jgi:hypothetical protein
MGLGKGTKYLSIDTQFPTRDLNPGFPEYEVGLFTTQSQSFV